MSAQGSQRFVLSNSHFYQIWKSKDTVHLNVYWLRFRMQTKKVGIAYLTALNSKTFIWFFLSWYVQVSPAFWPWQRAPDLPQKHWLTLLFSVVNLSRFFLWLVVCSPATIAALLPLLLSKLSLNQNLLYLQVCYLFSLNFSILRRGC